MYVPESPDTILSEIHFEMVLMDVTETLGKDNAAERLEAIKSKYLTFKRDDDKIRVLHIINNICDDPKRRSEAALEWEKEFCGGLDVFFSTVDASLILSKRKTTYST